MLHRHALGGLFAILFAVLSNNAGLADEIFLTNGSGTTTNGAIGVYTTSGATVNAALITGLTNPTGIAVSGSDVFVVKAGNNSIGNGTIGEYTTSGLR